MFLFLRYQVLIYVSHVAVTSSYIAPLRKIGYEMVFGMVRQTQIETLKTERYIRIGCQMILKRRMFWMIFME